MSEIERNEIEFAAAALERTVPQADTPAMSPLSQWEKMRRYRHFYIFVSPFFILFAVFGALPLVFSFGISFADWDGLTKIHWIGMGNFAELASDDMLRTVLWNTVEIGLLYIPPMLILAFLLAQMLNAQWLRLKGFFRAAVFLPCVTPMVVIAIVFGLLFSPARGVLNYGLSFLHVRAVPWLTSEQWSKVSVAILVVWRWTGYNMILMLAALQGIPKDYYEAAAIDGANGLRRTIHITLPLMKPIFRLCLLLSAIGTLYMFDEPFVLTAGGPGISSTTFGIYLFSLAFDDFHFGYASCVAYTVAIVVFVATVVANKLAARRAGLSAA